MAGSTHSHPLPDFTYKGAGRVKVTTGSNRVHSTHPRTGDEEDLTD